MQKYTWTTRAANDSWSYLWKIFRFYSVVHVKKFSCKLWKEFYTNFLSCIRDNFQALKLVNVCLNQRWLCRRSTTNLTLRSSLISVRHWKTRSRCLISSKSFCLFNHFWNPFKRSSVTSDFNKLQKIYQNFISCLKKKASCKQVWLALFILWKCFISIYFP